MRCAFGRISWVALLTALVAFGCEPTAELQTRPVQQMAVEPPAPVAEQPPTRLSDLAAQSQRDVDLILQSRQMQPGLSEGENDVVASSSPPPTPKKIMWNDPRPLKAPAASASTRPTVEPTPDAPASTALAANATEAQTDRPASLAPDRLKSLVVDLSKELYANGAYSTTPLRELLTIAAMSMIDPQRTLDPNAIPDLTEKERELLGHLQAFFAELGRSLDSPGRDTEEAIIEAVAKLREMLVKPPTLKLTTAALCTRVGGFGDYSQFEKYTFLAQSQQKAIVYLEIDEFTSVLNTKGEYVTQLAQQLTIYSDRDGIPVWKEDWQTAVDVTKNRRKDFFTVQVITLPKALTVGKYQLKVRVRDEQSQAEAETAITFELVADPRLVGK